jgi:hypothetical protein
MPAVEPYSVPGPEPRPVVRRRFQFSLFWLMVVVTIVAVIFGLGSSLGSLFSFLLFFTVRCIVPTPLVICVIFGRGYARAFSIGALMPWVTVLPWHSDNATLFTLAVTLIFSVICGVIAAGTWRWIRPNDAG